MKALAKKLLRTGIPVPRIIRPVVRRLYRIGVVVVEGLALVRKLLWIEPVMKSVCHSVGTGLRVECLPYMRGEGRLVFKDNIHLSGRSCFYFMANMPVVPEITIASGTFIGNGCTFSAARRIAVGAGCLVSTMVRIHDNDGHPLDPVRRLRKEPIRQDEAADVVIGDNVWIGAHAMILKGVTVGDHAVIAAGAVVTHDVPSCAVAAGNPARVVKLLEINRSQIGATRGNEGGTTCSPARPVLRSFSEGGCADSGGARSEIGATRGNDRRNDL